MTQPAIHIGFASRDITPPPGIPLAGYSARQGTAIGSLDGIHARAMVVRDPMSDTRLAFVTADLVAYSPDTIRAFRERTESETGFGPDDVILTVTHTHSGPAYGALFGYFSAPDLEHEPESSARWGEALPGVLLDLVREAARVARPATLSLGSTRVDVSTHRRLRDPLGEIRLAPNPKGATDPEIRVLHARSADDGQPIGTLVNYACHPVVLCEDNLRYSGDFPGYLLSALEANGAAAIYLNGTCGDINPKRRGDARTAQELGETLARAVEGVVASLESAPAHPIARAAQEVALPLRMPSNETLEAYVSVAEAALADHADIDNFEGRRLAAEVERARRMAHRLSSRRERMGDRIEGDTIKVRLQVARIGPALFAALPGETFVDLGRSLREQVGSEHLFVLGYANESIGYVPTRDAYGEGGYEVASSHLAPGTGEQLVAAAFEALERLERATGSGV